MEQLKTRFAPSPTGYMHIGQARTALFNYLLARKSGGTFMVRIEDTDVGRHQEDAIGKIIDDMRWLGLTWDEGIDMDSAGAVVARGANGPYRQSERLDTYAKYARQLLDAGKAYYAFDTEEEIAARRKQAEAEKRGFRYERPASFPTAADAEQAKAAGKPVVVRFACPNSDITIHDEAFGDVTVPASEMEDFVIQKADGYPTFYLANVVDDALMGVTLICRGQEFLGQTWRQSALRAALGFAEPKFAHLPLIMNPDNTKMSKRDKHKVVRVKAKSLIAAGQWSVDKVAELAGRDAATVEAWLGGQDNALETAQLMRIAASAGVAAPEIDVHDFRAAGYLPETLLNFVALLGWSPPGDREKMTLAEMVELFSIDRIGKANAKFDRAKLLAFNTDACAAAAPQRLLECFKDYLALNSTPIPTGDDALLANLLAVCHGFRTFADIVTKAGALFGPDDAFQYDPKAVEKVLRKNDGFALLAEARALLAGQAEFSREATQKAMDDFAAAKGLNMGKIAQPIRLAVTGTTISPGIAETLDILGKEKTLARIDRCLLMR